MPDEPLRLNLSADSAAASLPPVEQLQFRQAEPLKEHADSKRCLSCKGPISSTYYQAQGLDVCPLCAERLKVSQQAPPAGSLAKAALYGGGAALAVVGIGVLEGEQRRCVGIGEHLGRARRRPDSATQFESPSRRSLSDLQNRS